MKPRGPVVVVAVVLSGCSLPETGSGFNSIDPAERVNAVATAARTGDRGKARELVENFASQDPALRMLSFRAAVEMNAGETFGYNPNVSHARQREALKRWNAWADQVSGGKGDAAVGARGSS